MDTLNQNAPSTACLAHQVMKTCTYYLVTLTVLVNGGSAGWLLNKLSLRSDSAFVVDVLDLDNGTGGH